MRLWNKPAGGTHEDPVVEARANVDAVTAVVTALARAGTTTDAVAAALSVVRERIDDHGKALHFVQESGDAGDEVTMAASFTQGIGLSGRARRTRDLVFVPDVGEVTDCVRAPAAQRIGVQSGVCLPIVVGGAAVGTMDFFVTTTVRCPTGARTPCATPPSCSAGARALCGERAPGNGGPGADRVDQRGGTETCWR